MMEVSSITYDRTSVAESGLLAILLRDSFRAQLANLPWDRALRKKKKNTDFVILLHCVAIWQYDDGNFHMKDLQSFNFLADVQCNWEALWWPIQNIDCVALKLLCD